MDILELVKGHTDYNLHSHTQFCDGRAPMDVMARAAVEAGMKVYAFTPHSPLLFESPCNMAFEKVDEFLAETRRISELYKGRCTFLSGMEIDYIDNTWGPANEYFRNLPLDVRIGSVHFIPDFYGEPVDIDGRFENFRKKMSDRFRGDIDYVVDTFYAQSMAMLAEGGFDILGHLDKIGQNAAYYAPGIEDGSHYRACVDKYLEAIIKSGIVVELNTKAHAEHGRFFPSARYLKRLLEGGVQVVVNSDAHRPDRINASRQEALQLVKSLQDEIHA